MATAVAPNRLAALVAAFRRRPDLARLLIATGLGGAIRAALRGRK